MGIEGGEGEVVDLLVVHGHEALTGLDTGGEDGGGFDGGAAGGEADAVLVSDFEDGGVHGVDFDEAVVRVELAQDVGFAGAGVGVPLGGGAAAGEEAEGIGFVGRLGQGTRGFEKEAGAAVGVEKAAVGEEAALAGRGRRGGRREEVRWIRGVSSGWRDGCGGWDV